MRKPRGTALIVVLVVVLAISLLGAGIVVVSGRNLSAARQRETSVGLSACAMAVRQALASQIIGGTLVTNLSFTVPASSNPITLQAGHYANFPISDMNLSLGPPFGGGSGSSVQNLANRLSADVAAMPVQHTGSAMCSTYADSTSPARTYEVEFSWTADR